MHRTGRRRRPAPDVLQVWPEPFRARFTAPTWTLALTLVMGALLAPGRRTLTSCLRIIGRAMAANFGRDHQVLNRARWTLRKVSRRLILLLIGQLLDKDEPIVIEPDDTIQRRWGPRINARGIYRDPVRSSRGHFVKVSGLRWLSFMLLTPLPWLPGIKALPFLTLLAPSQRWAQWQRTSAQAADRTHAPGHAADPQMAAGPFHHLRRRHQIRNP